MKAFKFEPGRQIFTGSELNSPFWRHVLRHGWATAITTDVGHTLSPFAAGIVLVVLLIASYSRRSTWIALGSIAMSMAVLFGCLFLVTIHDRSHIQSRLAWVAGKFPFLLDQQTTERLAASLAPIETPSPCDAGQPGCGTETAVAAPPPAEREPVQATAAPTGWFDTKPDAKAPSQSPVVWALDDRGAQGPVSSPWGFSISGTNVSNEALEQVQAVLKPDSSPREVPLALSVDDDAVRDETVIPANAHFSLFAAAADEAASGQIGGAILTFRYVQAGQRKSSILYLTPAMVARFANRG